jgi:hypothetical protein
VNLTSIGLSFDGIPKSTRSFTPDTTIRFLITVGRLLLGTSISSSQTLAFILPPGVGQGDVEDEYRVRVGVHGMAEDRSHSNLDTRMSVMSITTQ